MIERVPTNYLRAASRRLANAHDLYRQARGRSYGDAFLELADVAMLIWSAGVDITSVLMLVNGEQDIGTSSSRRRYVTGDLHAVYPDKELRSGWGNIARLHNFQHNLDMPQEQFEIDCRGSGWLITELNELLPDGLRLPSSDYDWLLNVG